MANVTVIGAQWGDEGKGKIVDWLASRADAVVRFQGGHNAGHTLVVDGTTYKISLVPSGIVTGTLSLIGNGVVLDPWALKSEIEKLEGQGVKITADNFAGQGARFNQTISDFGDLSATLDDNKEELFSSLTEVQAFVSTLAENDTTVRQFNTSLADVSELLAGERQELVASLDNLGTALGQVKDFVETNQDVLGRDITKLNRVAKVLVKQRANLEEVVAVAPLALNNLYLP